jgi:hypothetical protein
MQKKAYNSIVMMKIEELNLPRAVPYRVEGANV